MKSLRQLLMCGLIVLGIGTATQAVKISHSTAGILVNDDFESYEAGTLSDGLNQNYWFPLYGYYNVSVNYLYPPGAYQGANYLSIARGPENYTSFFAHFAGQNSGIITANFAMYVPSGQFKPSAAILFEPDTTDQYIAAGLLVMDSGWVAYYNGNNWLPTGTGIIFDTWQEWTVSYNLDTDTMALNIGGSSATVSGTRNHYSVGAISFSPGAFGTQFYLDAVSGDSFRVQNKTFDVPAIAPINVDGDLSDWPASTPWSQSYIRWNGTDLSSTTQAKFAWNDADDTLYVAIRTNQVGGGHPVIGISTNIDAVAQSASGEATQLAFDIVGGSVEVMNEINAYSGGTYPHQTMGVTAAAVLGQDGYYTYEIAIPVWTNWVTPDTKVNLSGGSFLYVYSMMQDTFRSVNGMDMTYYGNPHFADAGGFHYASVLTLLAGNITPTPTPTPSLIPGDATGDGKVDVSDLGILAANYGGTGKTWAQGDFTGDGKVDVSDLGILAAHYGQGTSGGLDFNADAKALGLVVDSVQPAAKEDTPVTSTLSCGSAGLPLIAGLLLMSLLLVKLGE